MTTNSNLGKVASMGVVRKLEAERKKRKHNKAYFAKLLGIRLDMYTHYLAGRRGMSTNRVEKFAQLLNVPVSQLH